MNKLKTTCRFCSAPLPVIEGSDHSVCEYCGKAQPIVDTPTPLQQEPDKAPHIPDTVQSPPQVSPEDKVNVVVTNKNSQHNWGCLGFFIGLAVLIVVVFLLVKCSGKSSNNNRQNDAQQSTRQIQRSTQSNDYYQPPQRQSAPKVHSNGMPNVRTIPD